MHTHRLALLACFALLCACGQKGNLYLPDEREIVSAPQSSPVPQASPLPQASPAPAAAPAVPATTPTEEQQRQEGARTNRVN
jgi:predicted small lipoprotein YifL